MIFFFVNELYSKDITAHFDIKNEESLFEYKLMFSVFEFH